MERSATRDGSFVQPKKREKWEKLLKCSSPRNSCISWVLLGETKISPFSFPIHHSEFQANSRWEFDNDKSTAWDSKFPRAPNSSWKLLQKLGAAEILGCCHCLDWSPAGRFLWEKPHIWMIQGEQKARREQDLGFLSQGMGLDVSPSSLQTIPRINSFSLLPDPDKAAEIPKFFTFPLDPRIHK